MNKNIRNFCTPYNSSLRVERRGRYATLRRSLYTGQVIAHIDHPVPLRNASGTGRDLDFNYFVI